MAADIVEGADLARPVAHHDDRLAADRVSEEIARPWHLERVAGEQPMTMKYPCQIGVEDRGGHVKIAFQGAAWPMFADQSCNLGRQRLAGLQRRAVHRLVLRRPTYHLALPGHRPVLRFCEQP